MKLAVERTIPMFEDIDVPRVDTRPTIRTLRRRLCNAALRWYRDEVGYEEVLTAARQLDERLENSR